MTGTEARRTLLLCALCALCEGFDIQAAGVAAAGMRRELHLTPGELGFLFSAGGAGLLAGALAGGRLADRIGRKAVLVWSILLFGLFSLLTASAWDVTSMTAARLLTGFGLGGALPNLIALAADVSEATSRNTKVGITYVGMPLGAVVASFIALYLPSESWRTIFRAGGVAPLVIAPLVIFWMPRPAAIREKLEPPLRTLFAEGRAPVTLLLWTAFIFVVLSLHLLLNWLPLLMAGRGLTNAQAAAGQMGFNLGGATCALIVGRLLDTRWQRAGMAVCLVALPSLLLILAVSPPAYGIQIFLASLLGGALLAQQVITYGVASSCYPDAARGVGVGAAVAAGRLGSLTGPMFAAMLLLAGGGPVQVLLGLLPIAVLCSACVGALSWRRALTSSPAAGD